MATKDKRGFTFLRGTARTHYTDLDVLGGSSVRLVHDGKLPNGLKEDVRTNFGRAREAVDGALSVLSKGVNNLGPETRQALADELGIRPHLLTDQAVYGIRRRLEQIADGLHSSEIQIKLDEKVYAGDTGRSKIARAPHRWRAGRVDAPGAYSNEEPGVKFRMAKSHATNLRSGAHDIIGLVAQASAEANEFQAKVVTKFIVERLPTAVGNDLANGHIAQEARAYEDQFLNGKSPWPAEKPPQYEHVAKAPSSSERDSEAAKAIRAHIEDAAERAKAVGAAGNTQEAKTSSGAEGVNEKDRKIVKEQTDRLANELDDYSGEDYDAIMKALRRDEAVRGPSEVAGNELANSPSTNGADGTGKLPRNGLQGVEDQLVGLTNAAKDYDAGDREAIRKALLEGLNENQQDQVLRGLEKRTRTSVGR